MVNRNVHLRLSVKEHDCCYKYKPTGSMGTSNTIIQMPKRLPQYSRVGEGVLLPSHRHPSTNVPRVGIGADPMRWLLDFVAMAQY